MNTNQKLAGTGSQAGSGWQTLFLRNRYLLVLSIVVALSAGLFAFQQLKRTEDPRITNLYPIIITPFPGASAERVETLITEPLEDELAEVDTIKDMTSTSLAGVSVINIELVASIDKESYREVFAEIRDRVRTAAQRFPSGVARPVFDDKRDPAAFSLITALRWTGADEPNLTAMNRHAEALADRIRAVEGTEMVRLYGAPREEITVEVNGEELAALGLSSADVAASLAAADPKQPAGVLRGERSDVPIEVSGELSSVERIAAVPLVAGDDRSLVRVGDVADVQRGWQVPEREIGLVDGDRTVLVAARMARGRRIDRWSAEASTVVAEYARTVGVGITTEIWFDQAHYTDDRFAELAGNLVMGAFVVMLVVFLMMGWRLGMIVGLALPVTVGLTVFTFVLLDMSLHQMSVYGIVIALGLLIDNAIVVGDEVAKRKAAGRDAPRAVAEAVGHLFLPLLASTFTTVLAFLPIMLLPGGVGDFVGAIGKSVVIAVSWSFVTALTVTAGLAGIYATPTRQGGRRRWWRDGVGHPLLSRAFHWALGQGLRMPLATAAIALLLPLTGFVLAPSLGNSFFPHADRDMFEVRVWLRSDGPIGGTADYARAIETEVRRQPDVTGVAWMVGGNFPRVYYNLPLNMDGSRHFAHAIVKTNSNEGTKRALMGLQQRLEDRFPAAQILVKQFRQGPPLVADVEYRLYGPDVDQLIEQGEVLQRMLQEDPEVVVAQSTMTKGSPKFWVDVNEDQARLAGLSLTDVAGQMQAHLEGLTGGMVLEDLEQLPVRVRQRDSVRGNLQDIASMQLVVRDGGLGRAGVDGGEWIPLTAVGELDLRPELSSTTRFNGLRTNIIKGYTTIDALPINVSERVLERFERETGGLPPGFRMELGGTVDQEAETQADLLAPLPILAVFIVAALILTFRSVLLAGILGVVAIMSVGMAILSTWWLGLPISFNTFMGTFGLIGVALNDSIVVIAAIRSHPKAAAGEIDGLVAAVSESTRHVIATTLTTIGGFLPLIVLVGGNFWPSLSIVLAGGIVGASIMALLLIPALYRLLRRWLAVRPEGDSSAKTSATEREPRDGDFQLEASYS